MNAQGAARVVQVNVSRGGVPKRAVPSARIGRLGLEGDAQNDRRYHGGPERAVCVWSQQVIDALRAEGHPVEAGGAGENLTLAGLDWAAVRPGARLLFESGVELEVTAFAAPCKLIRGCFLRGDFERISDKLRPGSSRAYCRVLREGRVAPGHAVRLEAPGAEAGAGPGAAPGAPPPGC